MKPLNFFKLLGLFISALLIGCAVNQYAGLSESIGIEEAVKCQANAQYFMINGKNENYTFGPSYLKPYATDKWLTAILMNVFYTNVSANYGAKKVEPIFQKYYKKEYFTKEVADQCQKTFDAAPIALRDAAYNQAPFFSDKQSVNLVCQSNSPMDAASAISYAESGVRVPPAFGSCVKRSVTKRLRELDTYSMKFGKNQIIGNYERIGSFDSGGLTLYIPIASYDKYKAVSYFPDLKTK